MKTLAKLVMLLVVVALSVPAYGEILLYRSIEKDTYFRYEAGEWKVEKEKNKGYIVLNVDYATGTIEDASAISYWKGDKGNKGYNVGVVDLELVIVDAKRKSWVILEKIADPEELSIIMMAGNAKDTNIGTGQKREVARSLKGYILDDDTPDPDRSLQMSTISLRLYSKWTKWFNNPAGPNQDFNLSVQEVIDYLEDKGYQPDP